jgi:hypothetical protein
VLLNSLTQSIHVKVTDMSYILASLERTQGKGMKSGTRKLLARAAIAKRWPKPLRNALATDYREKRATKSR